MCGARFSRLRRMRAVQGFRAGVLYRVAQRYTNRALHSGRIERNIFINPQSPDAAKLPTISRSQSGGMNVLDPYW